MKTRTTPLGPYRFPQVLFILTLLNVPVLSAGGPLQIPANGVYLGIRANPTLGANQEAAIEVNEGNGPAGIGRRFSLHLLYYGWQAIASELDGNGVLQPDVELGGDIAKGRVPVIAWGCDMKINNSNSLVSNGDANEDAVITDAAKALAQVPGPVLLRWQWEFNHFNHSPNCIGNATGPSPQLYADFIGAWRRIRTLFNTAGATNVSFV